MYKYIILSVEDKIATITINRPELANAIDPPVFTELKSAIEECSKNPEVGTVVITGAGKHFSAGGNINDFKELIESKTFIKSEDIKTAGETAAAIRRCPKPVIAMVNGVAAGAGCSISLACDFRIMTPKSSLVMAFITMGLPGDTGGIYYLQKVIGIAKTTEMIMTGAPVSGEEAVRIGLATKLAEDGQLREVTYNFAKKLTNKPLLALKRQKEMLLEFFNQDIEKFTEKEAEYMVECSRSEDFTESVYAFFEKRPPQYTGK